MKITPVYTWLKCIWHIVLVRSFTNWIKHLATHRKMLSLTTNNPFFLIPTVCDQPCLLGWHITVIVISAVSLVGGSFLAAIIVIWKCWIGELCWSVYNAGLFCIRNGIFTIAYSCAETGLTVYCIVIAVPKLFLTHSHCQ